LEPWRGLWRLARRIVEAFGNKQRGKRQPSNGIAPKLKRTIMPKKPIERARQDEREGKAPSTQAGEFICEEIELIREGAHGARSTKQAIAIGLSKARRAGVKLPPPKKGTIPEKTREKGRSNSREAISRARWVIYSAAMGGACAIVSPGEEAISALHHCPPAPRSARFAPTASHSRKSSKITTARQCGFPET
jgi:hypothetical protein